MFFLSKEKKLGSSRVLTESEIKKKLYGQYETTSSDTHSSSLESKMTQPTFETRQLPQRESLSGSSSMRTTSFGATSRPESLVTRSSSIPLSDKSSERPVTFQKPLSTSSKTNSDRRAWRSNSIQIVQFLGGFLAGLLWKTGSYLVQALEFLLKILDPRKPQARKLLYSITACVLVVALFLGVFRLNAQRKKAMMGELSLPTTSALVGASEKSAKTEISLNPLLPSAPLDPKSQLAVRENQDQYYNSADRKVGSSSVAPAAPAVAAGKYVIQVATYAVLEDANRLIESINQAGFSAFFKKQSRSSTGHTFYPVYLGRFESSFAAQQSLSKFRKASVARPFQDAFVRTLE